MLKGQMGKHKCVFEMSAGEMRLMVGTKGAMVIVIYGLVLAGCRCEKCQQIFHEGVTSQFSLSVP